MRVKTAQLARCILLAMFVVYSPTPFADQTDSRLDELFLTLRSSDDPTALRYAESQIWIIWYQSGEQEVDQMMEEGRKAVSAGELAIAEQIYSQVIERLPEYSEGWNRRATVRYYRENYEGSLVDIRQTLLLEPRHFGAIWGLGMILGWQQEFSAAITAFEKLLEIKPNSADARPRIQMLREELEKSMI